MTFAARTIMDGGGDSGGGGGGGGGGGTALAVSLSVGAVVTTGSVGALLISASVTGTATGGTAPYGYAWTPITGELFTVTTPTAAATTFRYTPPFEGAFVLVYRLTVTDAAGGSVFADVEVEFEGF